MAIHCPRIKVIDNAEFRELCREWIRLDDEWSEENERRPGADKSSEQREAEENLKDFVLTIARRASLYPFVVVSRNCAALFDCNNEAPYFCEATKKNERKEFYFCTRI